jgi:site-specific DNA recombinase
MKPPARRPANVFAQAPTRVALYGRVSSEDQAERGSIDAQKTYLRDFAKLQDLYIVQEYYDDGISGTIPLDQRPAGQKLLADAEQHSFDTVLVYRVDRFARSLNILLAGYNLLEAAGVALKSASEPYDSSTPVGKFVFQLLGGLAELEKGTILERTGLGRDRVVRAGKWAGGVIPFGYDLDAQGHLTLKPEESNLVRSVFENNKNGSTLYTECQRLQEMGIQPVRRYRTKSVPGKYWRPNRLWNMLKRALYYGEMKYKSKRGLITYKVPSIASKDLWYAVQSQLEKNKCKPQAKIRYNLLRGMIRCSLCHATMLAAPSYRSRNGKSIYTGHYYRCANQFPTNQLDKFKRCPCKQI